MQRITRELEERKKQKALRESQLPPEEPDELEATVEYARRQSLNRAASVFDNGSLREGINTRKSVFDRSAVFTREGDS